MAILFCGGYALVFSLLYSQAKSTAITRLNEEQMLHARQAVRSIQDFFAMYTQSLTALSKTDEIIDVSANGQRDMNLFCEAHRGPIGAITRLDESGHILYSFPSTESVQSDIAGQLPVSARLRNQQPVIGEVFRTFEGYDAVTLYVPVFRGSDFQGSLGVLVNLRNLGGRYLEAIRIGKTGYAWVVSRDGSLLYSPVPGFTGKSVFDAGASSPSVRAMAGEMLRGREGETTYAFDRIGDRTVRPTRKYAVYAPIPLENTYWSIAVATAEEDVLSGLITFRNRLAIVLGIMLICGMALSALGVKAWFIVREEDKRRLAGKKLRESEQRFRQVAETAEEFIWEIDADGLYTYASPSVERILGYTPTEVVGRKHFYDMFEPSVREELKASAFRVMTARQAFLSFSNANISKRGKLVHLETSGTPEQDPAGNFTGYIGSDTDVTARRQSELEIMHQRNELAHITRVSTMGQLASSLAHELNQPLGAILRNAEAAEMFLQEAAPDLEEVRAILVDIRKDGARAGAVIDRMRAMLKRREVERCRLDLNLLAGEVITLLRPDAEVRHVGLAPQLSPGLSSVLGDRVQLQQVLLNLLFNAMDAVNGKAAPDRLVALRTRLAGGAVEVAVSDNGQGIPPGTLAHLFEPFFTSKPNGLGMGLAISRSIIEAHGGRIEVENNPQGGATVRFAIPAGQEGGAI